MMTLNSNHGEGIMEGRGFGGVEGSCDYFVQSPDQPLQLVPHPVGFNVSLSGTRTGMDGRRVRKKSSSKPTAPKKKNGYHHRQGVKKPRLIWTPELHEAFVEIYNRIPKTVIFPKKILEQMRIKYPFITRENIASHLQKHRLNLKKQMDKENSAKFSSKSVPFKIPKKSNSQSIRAKTSKSNSRNPNSQLIFQSHSNSTNPSSDGKMCVQNSQGCGFELREEQFEQFHGRVLIKESTNPNFHLSLPKKSHIKPEPLLNHQVHFHFDQTNNVSNHIMMNQQQQASFNNNFDGGSYSYSNMINVSESQENTNWALPIGQSSIAPNSDLAFSINLYPPPISANQISGNGNVNGNFNGDVNGNGNVNGIGFHPIMDFNSFGGWNNTNNDPFLGTLPNFGFGDYYDMNLNFDNNVQVGHDSLNNDNCYPGSYPEPLDFGYPLNFNTTNDFQMDFGQGLQSMFYPSVKPMENDFTFQQCGGSYNHPLVPHTFGWGIMRC